MLIELVKYVEKLDVIDLDLPNNQQKIQNVKTALDLIDDQINLLSIKNDLELDGYNLCFEKIRRLLYFVADISLPCYQYNKFLEEHYFFKYKHQPVLAKKLWLCHYALIHEDYNELKNRCYRLFNKLNKKYKIVDLYSEFED